MATFLTGVPRLENLVCLLDNEWHDRVGEVTPPMAEEIREFGRQMFWPCPTPITLQPVSAVVVKVKWYCPEMGRTVEEWKSSVS